MAPSLGNRAYQMTVHGKNILYYPSGDISENRKNPELGGVPFLAPWADLLDEQAFWANGKRYGFNMSLGNIRGERPIHGLLTDSPLWQVLEVAADANSAHVLSRLEFWKYPDLMAQWPFAHEYEMTYSLVDGVLEVIRIDRKCSGVGELEGGIKRIAGAVPIILLEHSRTEEPGIK